MCVLTADNQLDREEALKDDFQFDSGTYGYEDDEDEWADNDGGNWNAEDDNEEEINEVKDESTAYLEFLNEEVTPTQDMFWPTQSLIKPGPEVLCKR